MLPPKVAGSNPAGRVDPHGDRLQRLKLLLAERLERVLGLQQLGLDSLDQRHLGSAPSACPQLVKHYPSVPFTAGGGETQS